MIKNIYMHAGLHKTGTTTIQSVLFGLQRQLKDRGYLYPEIQINDKRVDNHAHQIQSLFTENPLELPKNISAGIADEKALHKAHASWRSQLEQQLQSFDGESLVLSGEHISLLSEQGLHRLVEYLKSITHKQVAIWVIVFVRHPVTRNVSAAQQVIKSGLTIEAALARALKTTRQHFRNRLQKFIHVFGKEQLKIIRFEDAVQHEHGLSGCFLSAIGLASEVFDVPKEPVHNPAVSYEGVVLIDAINRKMPRPAYGVTTQDHRYAALGGIIKMPGSKYDFSNTFKSEVWEASVEDMKWLCRTFSLRLYDFEAKTDHGHLNKWELRSLFFLYLLLLHQNTKSRKIVLEALKSEVRKYKTFFSLKKRLLIWVNYFILSACSLFLMPLDRVRFPG